MGFGETLSFQQMVNHLFTEGTVPVPPNRPFALRQSRITFPGIIAPVVMPQRRGWRHYLP